MEYISMDEVKTIIEFCPLIKCYGDPGTEKPFGKCSAFRNSGEEPIDVCKMCKACSTYEDDIDDDCLEDRDRDVHGINEGCPIEILMDSENQIILRKKHDPIVQTTIEELKEICTALKYNPELDVDIIDYSVEWARTIEDAISLLQKKG